MVAEKPLITCRQLIDFIGDYIDGALDDGSCMEFERHLARCRSCQAYLETYRQTKALARTLLATDDAVEDVPEELIETILAARHRSSS